MPVCCGKQEKGRRPAVKIYRSGNGDKTWYAIVGSEMLTGYADREKLNIDAQAAKMQQRVMKCGHVVKEA